MKVVVDQNTEDLKDILFDLLEPTKVKKFTVSFDGNGDSGQIEDISLDKNILEMKVEGVKVPNGIRYSPNGSEQLWEDANTLNDVIDSICYESLEKVCGGWEINEGSYGEFTFDVKNRKVRLGFNERVMDVRSSEYEL